MSTAPNVRMIEPTIKGENGKKYRQKLRVAAYCRVSTELEEQQNSYQVQIAYYTDLIQKNPEWVMAGVFADEGLSGTSMKKRTEFNHMIRLCQQKKIDMILCKSTSRFARNTVDCLETIRMLKSLGIGVIFEKENINTLTMNSEFMLTLYGSFAQAESESISKNVSLGVKMAFQQGKVRHQYKYWLGYRKGEDGQPEIIPEDAETVREIFRLFLDGYSIGDITRNMIQQERRNALGTTDWNTNAIRRILTNEKYTGDALLQKTYTTDCITHRSVKNNGERTMYLVTDCHPAVIDRDTYHLAQQELARRTSKRKVSTKSVTEQGKYSSKFALTELMICGECGTPYRRCTWNVHGKKRIVWRCLNRLEHGSKYCHSSPTIHEEPLHRTIIREINAFYACGEDVAELLKENAEAVLAGLGQAEITSVESRLAQIDKARQNMIDSIVSGVCEEEAMYAEFEKLHVEEEELTTKLQELKAQCQISAEEQRQLETTLEDVENARFELDCFDNVLVRKLIECVRVLNKEKIEMIFKGGYEVTAEMEK